MMVMVVAHAPSLMDLIFKTQREQAKTAQAGLFPPHQLISQDPGNSPGTG
jgi:hypothetical protein